MSTMIRTHSEMSRYSTLEERFRYLSLAGQVGEATFGFDRYLNQQFYRSREWKRLRNHVILRDNGCDLGVEGYDIHTRLIIHHMNPMTIKSFTHGDKTMMDPEFLVTTTHKTHNAIHFGDESLLPKPHTPRIPGDTRLW